MDIKKQDTNGLKTRSPATECSLTLKDLYCTLDWSAVDVALVDFLKKPRELFCEGEESLDTRTFSRRFRFILLHEALYGFGEPKTEARRLLHMAGVWSKVVDFMRNAGLVIPNYPA